MNGKIRLAILEKDKDYLKRIVDFFNAKYPDKLEVRSFTDPAYAMEEIEDRHIRVDVFLVDEDFDIDLSKLPGRCGVAYLVNSADIDTYHEQTAIFKFQKPDLIYKQIQWVYSSVADAKGLMADGNSRTKVIAFQSVAGGSGASTMAAACAIHLAKQDKKVMYLNLEKCGTTDCFFSGVGKGGMEKVIDELIDNKDISLMKLESLVKEDKSRVQFFSQSKEALDMMELTPEQIIRLIRGIKQTDTYDALILDMDFSLRKEDIKVLYEANVSILVGDGTEISNKKMKQAVRALGNMDGELEIPVLDRTYAMYNKFSSGSNATIPEDLEIDNLGGAPVERYKNASSLKICETIAAKNGTWEKLSGMLFGGGRNEL